MTREYVRPCDVMTEAEARPRPATPEYRASLRVMHQRLWSLELLHDMLGDHGIHFFDEDCGCMGFSWGETLHEISAAVDEARADGEEYYDDLRGVVFFALPDMDDLREGRDFHLAVSLPLGDDGHDAEARTRELTVIVSQKLTALGITHQWEADGVITIPAANLPLASS